MSFQSLVLAGVLEWLEFHVEWDLESYDLAVDRNQQLSQMLKQLLS